MVLVRQRAPWNEFISGSFIHELSLCSRSDDVTNEVEIDREVAMICIDIASNTIFISIRRRWPGKVIMRRKGGIGWLLGGETIIDLLLELCRSYL